MQCPAMSLNPAWTGNDFEINNFGDLYLWMTPMIKCETIEPFNFYGTFCVCMEGVGGKWKANSFVLVTIDSDV